MVDNNDGSYDITYTIEKAGPYHLNLTAGPKNHPIGDCKVKCVPAEACGKNSVASGDGIHKAKIGTFTISIKITNSFDIYFF